MSSPLLARARSYAVDAARAFERAPVEVVAAVLTALAFSCAIEVTGFDFRAWIEVAIVALLIAGAAWLATLLHRLGGLTLAARWAVTAGGAALAGVYGSLVLDLALHAEAWRAGLLVAAGAGVLIGAPAFAPGEGSRTDRMRRVDGRILLRAIGVLLYGAALFAGLALALASVNALFELELRGTLYGHVFGWIFLVLVPWVIVGGVSDYAAPADSGDAIGAAVRRMAGFLVPPLVAIYLAILVAYVARMAVTGEVPKNLVSPLVIAAGTLGLLALVLFDPAPRRRGAFGWLRGVPGVFLPLGGLGIWAITLRLGQYGITEFRALRIVVLLVLLLLAAGAVWQVWRRRRFPLHVAPFAFAAAFLLAAVGPWSVLALAERSQTARLDALLAEAGFAAALPADAGTVAEIDAELYDNLSSTARYVVSHFGEAALPPRLARHATGETDHYDIARRAGLRPALASGRPGTFASARLADGVPVPAAAGGEYYRIQLGPAGWRREASAPGGVVRASQDGLRLTLRVQATVFAVDLAALEHALRTAGDSRLVELGGEARLAVLGTDGGAGGHMLVLDVHADWPNGEFRLQRLDALLMLDREPASATR